MTFLFDVVVTTYCHSYSYCYSTTLLEIHCCGIGDTFGDPIVRCDISCSRYLAQPPTPPCSLFVTFIRTVFVVVVTIVYLGITVFGIAFHTRWFYSHSFWFDWLLFCWWCWRSIYFIHTPRRCITRYLHYSCWFVVPAFYDFVDCWWAPDVVFICWFTFRWRWFVTLCWRSDDLLLMTYTLLLLTYCWRYYCGILFYHLLWPYVLPRFTPRWCYFIPGPDLVDYGIWWFTWHSTHYVIDAVDDTATGAPIVTVHSRERYPHPSDPHGPVLGGSLRCIPLPLHSWHVTPSHLIGNLIVDCWLIVDFDTLSPSWWHRKTHSATALPTLLLNLIVDYIVVGIRCWAACCCRFCWRVSFTLLLPTDELMLTPLLVIRVIRCYIYLRYGPLPDLPVIRHYSTHTLRPHIYSDPHCWYDWRCPHLLQLTPIDGIRLHSTVLVTFPFVTYRWYSRWCCTWTPPRIRFPDGDDAISTLYIYDSRFVSGNLLFIWKVPLLLTVVVVPTLFIYCITFVILFSVVIRDSDVRCSRFTVDTFTGDHVGGIRDLDPLFPLHLFDALWPSLVALRSTFLLVWPIYRLLRLPRCSLIYLRSDWLMWPRTIRPIVFVRWCYSVTVVNSVTDYSRWLCSPIPTRVPYVVVPQTLLFVVRYVTFPVIRWFVVDLRCSGVTADTIPVAWPDDVELILTIHLRPHTFLLLPTIVIVPICSSLPLIVHC